MTARVLLRRAAPTRACTPRSSSIRRRTPHAGCRSRPCSTASSARPRMARASWASRSRLIMCFLRHLPRRRRVRDARAGDAALRAASHGVGLDSSERGHPPSKFARVFARCRELGLACVAHAGEEGPPEYIWEALDMLKVRRIDHGVRCDRGSRGWSSGSREQRIPLTVCPLSNVKLRVFPDMHRHNLKAPARRGLAVTINSDDPAYFGGYMNDNIRAVQEAHDLSVADWHRIARTSFEASFVDEATRRRWIADLDDLRGSQLRTAAPLLSRARHGEVLPFVQTSTTAGPRRDCRRFG